MSLRRALVVSGGGFQGLALVKALRQLAGVYIVLVDIHAENATRFLVDRFLQAPPLAPEHPFLSFALAVVQAERIDAVFGATNFELKVLATHRDAFAALGAEVYVPALSLLAIAEDKLALHEWLTEHGLPTLPTWASPNDPGANFPLLGKPRAGWGGRGIIEVSCLEGLARLPAGLDGHYAWQPALSQFEEYSIDFAVATDRATSPIAIRRRVRTTGGFAVVSGPCEDARVPPIASQLVAVVAAGGGLGPMNAQILANQEGCWVSDLNPRIGTSAPLSLASGVRLLDVLDAPRRARSPMLPVLQRGFRYLEERCIPSVQLLRIEAVVFDLDDTLIDHKRWIRDKLVLTWEALSHRLPAREEFLAASLCILEDGNRARLLDGVIDSLGLPGELRPELIDAYRGVVPDTCHHFDDVLPCLEGLRRSGRKLAIVTDNPAESQRRKLERSVLAAHFDAVVLSDELGTRKPDPAVFDTAVRALDLARPERAVMVGDHLFRDIRGALDAGLGHAFFLSRPGSFYNFDPSLSSEFLPADRWTRLQGLVELNWYLPSA